MLLRRTVAFAISVLLAAIAAVVPVEGQVAPPASAPAAPAPVDSARAIADTTAALRDSAAVSRDTTLPPATAPPVRSIITQPRRGSSPYNVVADRLEGGRTALEGEVIMLIGNVTLSRDGTVVKSQTGRYVKREGTIYLTGGVDAVDGGTRVTALQAAYNEATDFLTLMGQVVVRDKDLVLESDQGSYDQSRGRAELWSRVRGRDRTRTLTADRVTYLRDEQVAQARGRVVARDSTEGLTLTGEAIDYDRRREFALATARPTLVQAGKNGKGATTLVGDTITVATPERIATAAGSVVITRDSLRAEAGRMVYYDREERGVLTGEPRAWTDEVDVRGDSLEIFTRDQGIDRLLVLANGRIEYHADSGADAGGRSLLTAQRMDVWFDAADDGIDSLYATGEAANEFTGKPLPDRLSESNRTTGDLVRLYFDGKDLQEAIVTGKAAGTYRAELAASDTAGARANAVEYEADRIVFEVPKNRIRLEQNAVLRYEQIALRAPEVLFDVKQQVLEARGNPQLEDRGDTLRGTSLAYDLETRRGTVFGARTRYQTGWYAGDKIRRLGDDVIDVGGARYSTCNLDDPHYAFRSDRMKIYLKDKIIARPVLFTLKHVPLLALPFYVFPIRQERTSGLLVPQIQFGFGDATGGYIRNAGYYFAPNDYTDFTVSGDWYPQVPSWVLRGEARYKSLYKFEGQMQGSIGRSFYTTEERNWDFRAQHAQTINDATSLTARANFTSSADYTRDPLTGLPLANRIDRFLTSNLTLSHRRPWASINLVLSRQEDLDTNPISSPLPKLQEQLPSLSIVLPSRTLGHKPGATGGAGFLPFLSTTYLGFNARFLNDRTVSTFLRRDESGAIAVFDTSVARRAYQHVVTLNDNRRLGFVNFGPTFRWTEVVYQYDATGKSPSAGGTWAAGAGASMTLYGTSHGGLGPITSIRHVFQPIFSYSFQPQFSRLRVQVPTSDTTFATVDRFPPFGGIGLSGTRQSFLSVNLVNRFEAKVRTEKGERVLSNLLGIGINTAYDFLHEANGRETPWQPILTTVRVQPPNYISGDLSLRHDPAVDKLLRNASASLSLRFAGGGRPPAVAEIPLAGNEAQTRGPRDQLVPWSLSTSISYGGSRNVLENWQHSESANLVAEIQPTANWTVHYYNQIDLNERRIVAQEWSVTRTLHCWQAQFVRRFSGGTADYYFKIGILDRPEIFLDRGTAGLGTIGGLGSLGGIGSSLVP